MVTGVRRSRAIGRSSCGSVVMGCPPVSDSMASRGAGGAKGSPPTAPTGGREPFAAPAPLSPVADAARVRAAQAGDAIAMSEVLDALLPLVGRLCGAIALDAGRSEERRVGKGCRSRWWAG